MLDPSLHQSRQPRQLFVVNEHQEFTCELQPNMKQDHPNRHERLMHVIHVKPAMFSENRIPYSDVTKLIDMWQTSGVRTLSGIICKNCEVSQPSIPSTSLKKKKRQLKKINSDISVVSNPSPPDQSLHCLYETSCLHFDDSQPPLHLYFYLDITTLPENGHKQSNFMGSTDWPFNLTVGGAMYTLMSRGYWNGTHYWSQINLTLAGVTGIWLQNNADNAGWARLMSTNPSTIAGPSDGTSWVMYSRTWTTDESEYVKNVISKVAKDHPNPPGELNFNLMHALGPLASETKQKQPIDLHENHDCPDADEPDESAPDDGQEFTLLELDFADLDEEEVILPELDLADLRPEDADALVTSQPPKPGKNKTLKSVTPTIAPKCKTPTTETAPHKNVRRKKVVFAAPLPEEPSISAPLMPDRPTAETIPKRRIRPNKVGIIKPQAKAPLVPPIAASSDALTIPTQPKKRIRPKKLDTIQPVANAPIAPPLGDTMITVPVIPDALTLETQPNPKNNQAQKAGHNQASGRRTSS
ncbi:hypothetical protein PSHT_07865 [Puccinia striiformis]|uniref:Uncharacterized protein n=1 Tax=Puccinia striiformis TaxID=27350 RepID=A0A2S4VUD4_9BASI|nr:hypothetical protein PSHT_07865 [Puccinia striiformis]